MRAWVGLGSNLDDPLAQLRRAVHAIAQIPQSQLIAVSSAYRSPALRLPGDETPQPDFCNAVVAIETALSPLDLLSALQAIEQQQGRTRERRWGARTLDLDLLLCGNEIINSPRLTVPHPGICERLFVLQPLLETAPELLLPDGTAVSDALARCPPMPLSLAGSLT